MHESNSILKLLCSQLPFPDTLGTDSLEHVILVLSELRYLNGTLKAFKDKMPDL